MIGNWRWNITLAAAGFLLTFLLSTQQNLLTTSLLRSCYSFAIWFVIGYAVRFLLSMLLSSAKSAASGEQAPAQEQIGSQLDIVIPDDAEPVQNKLQQKEDDSDQAAGFTPLDPPKLVRTSDKDPEQLARAIRHLTEE